MKIVVWTELSITAQKALLKRPLLRARQEQCEQVLDILQEVKRRGDSALFDYNKQFDQASLKVLKVTKKEIEAAEQSVFPEALAAIQFAIVRITAHHSAQPSSDFSVNTTPGISCERESRPIDKVGLYIPGGSAPLVSSVLMLAIPAKLAKCPHRILCTPPNSEGKVNPHLLLAAKLSGIHHIYKVGGAQAIAAMAYGTESILAVDKIFGPGNSWVTLAKRLLAQDENLSVSIDMPAGPSEVLVIADKKANPHFVAADLLSQAEHGPDSQVILISPDQALLNRIQRALAQQLKTAQRKSIIEEALKHARFILSPDIETAIEISNQYAPEHLILQLIEPEPYKQRIRNAGAVFLGAYTPETLGDYVTGSNHVLPTGGYAKSISGLSVSDFCKHISFQRGSPIGIRYAGLHAQVLAEIEGLFAHRNAITERLEEIQNKGIA